MSWMQTYTGIPFNLDEVSKDLIHQVDIVTALSRQPRFNGHTRHTLSVAQHSCLVADMVEEQGGSPELILAALLHDGHEAYMSDIPSPIKWHLGEAWEAFKDVERRIDQAIADRFGFDHSLFYDELLKHADGSALWYEKHSLLNDNGTEWEWDKILHGNDPLPLPYSDVNEFFNAQWDDTIRTPWDEKRARVEFDDAINERVEYMESSRS